MSTRPPPHLRRDDGACPSFSSDDLGPSSFGYYDALYDRAASAGFASSSRVGSVEVVPPLDANGTSVGSDGTYALLRIVTINALTASQLVDGEKTLVPRGNGGTQIYGDLAGILLGVHHFNNGIGAVVQEVEGIHEKCPVRFAMEDFYDSESSQTVAVNHFSRTIINSPDRPPSGLFGAWRSAVSIPLAILSGAYSVPQISPLSTSTELDDKNIYRYFSRLVPSDAGTARAVVDYLTQDQLNVGHLGMVYVNDAYGSAFHQAIVEASLSGPEDNHMTVKGHPFSYSDNVAESSRLIDFQMEELARTGYRYFFGVIYDEHYKLIMEAAHRHGIAGPGYVWIFSDGLSNTFLEGRVYETGSALAIASQGIGILKAEGGRESLDGDKGYDRFAQAWYEQDSENVDYYNCKQPKNNTLHDPSIYFKAQPDFFTGRQLSPTAGAVFTYDSAIALGLAACELYEKHGDAYFNSEELFNGFVSQSFEGASGDVRVDAETASRDPSSAFFVLYNARGQPNGEGGIVFDVNTVAHSAPNPDSSDVRWVGYQDEVYVYSDGTSTPPASLPPPDEDLNQLSRGIRAVGLTIAAIVFALAVFFGLWTKRNCKKRVIKASQPEFLYMICFGVVVLASTIIPLSIDDSVVSSQGCDKACMSIPWLFNCGFVTAFSALFAKTWRLNKVMANVSRSNKMRVRKKDAMKPFLGLMVLNTIILVVWTEVDPLRWVRIDNGSVDSFGRSISSYGTCTSDGRIGFIVALFIINFSVVILAIYQSYHARNLSTEFSESKYISIIMASVFQSIVIGLPLYIIVAKDPSASFIVMSCIIGAMCLSTLVFMFVPKMVAMEEQRVQSTEDATEEQNASNLEGSRVELRTPTEVKADLGDEDVEEGGMLMNIWDGVKGLFAESGNYASNNDAEGAIMSGKSIFVGTLVQDGSEGSSALRK